MTPTQAVTAIRKTHGACSVGTVAERAGTAINETAQAMVAAIEQGLLIEHPTMPNIYGLPKWYA